MRLIAVSTLCLLAVLVVPAAASAGQYSVASCQADQVMFSTRAFTDFATRGMSIRRACNPQGRGLRGLVTGNVVRRQPLRRGAVSLVAITAPAGTRFTTFRWAGTARRVDCRFALQLYADVPGGKAIPMKNVRANRRCPRKRRAQSAYYPVRTFSVPGASRIVQRVICVGNRSGQDLLRARQKLHPHVQGERRRHRQRWTDRLDHRRHPARPRRLGQRQPSPQLHRC